MLVDVCIDCQANEGRTGGPFGSRYLVQLRGLRFIQIYLRAALDDV
jgi:hypothetical protein